jgi:galactonate dehydratase
LAEVKHTIGLPVVTGEELYTKNEFRDVIGRRVADILNPDVCNCGGILELREIAAMAECHHIAVSPHNYNSTTIGLAATVHATASMPNFIITEYFVNFEEVSKQIAVTPLVAVDGYIELPTMPGLGVDLDEVRLQEYPYREFPNRPLRTPEDE